MVSKKLGTWLLATIGLVFLLSPGALTLAQDFPSDYIAGAREILSAARTGLDKARLACQQETECSPDLLGQLDGLQQGIDLLSALIAQRPPDTDAIRAGIDNLAQIVQSVCSQLGQCVDSSGAELEIDVKSEPRDPTAGGLVYYRRCIQAAQNRRLACRQNVNKLVNCSMRVPFCDWSSFPFDAAAFVRDCQSFVNAGLLPSCRCPCPQSERQGGCGQFFQTGVMCSDCSESACQRGSEETRCSCSQLGAATLAGRNSVQCDLCRWSNVALAVSELRRKLLCEKPYTEDVQDCRDGL